jgi:predicted nucleotidyltransferase
MRLIPPEFDPIAVSAIDDRLRAIQRDHAVRIPLAVESGSRAWGFPSPDSDYDARFFFVRRRRDYLSPWPERDVIETPLQGLLDVNGWDLRKALQLLLKGNAVVIEWLQSPIRYIDTPWFRDEFLALAGEITSRSGIERHYGHLARRQLAEHLRDPGSVLVKKLFYVLRPLLAARWLRQRPQQRIAPMAFQTLVAETDLPPSLVEILDELIRLKASLEERARRPVAPLVGAFIADELNRLPAIREGSEATTPQQKEVAVSFLLKAVERLSPEG